MKFKEMNLPNKLTTIRMYLVVVMFLLFTLHMLYKNISLPVDYKIFEDGKKSLTVLQIIMAFVFALASFTDYLDGHIARKNNIVSDYGKLMDPLADKLLVNSTIIFLLATGTYNSGYENYKVIEVISIVFSIVVIARDIFIDALRMQALKKNVVVPASFYGKLKTATLMPGVIIMILSSMSPILYVVGLLFMTLGGIFALIGGVDYFAKMSKYIEN